MLSRILLNILICAVVAAGIAVSKPGQDRARRHPAPTAWTPPSQSGLQAWFKNESGAYDATSGGSLVTSDGSSVARWEDQSGNSSHVTQSTSGNRPVLKTGANGINGHAVLQYDGTNDDMSLSSWSTSGNDFTLFAVYSLNSDVGYCIAETSSTSVDSWWRWDSGGGEGYWGVFLSSRIASQPPSMPTTGNHYLVARVTSGGTYEIYLDGASAYSTTSFSFVAPSRISIGSLGDGNANKYTNGKIAEVGIYSVNSSTLRDNLNTYMATKYGL